MADTKKMGKRMVVARRVTLSLVLIAVLASLAFDFGIGRPSSFGVGEFNLLCPLGGIEAMVASKSFIPVAAISAGVVLVLSLLFGRAWCAWGCPAPVIRRFFKRDPKPAEQAGAGCPSSFAKADGEASEPHNAASACGALRSAWSFRESVRFVGCDPRTWTFLAVILAAFIAGLPLFCLICPVGLTFGTVGSLWHLIVDKQMTLSVLVFPAALAVELVLYRKWCMNLCPIAGLLGIVGQFALLFRPKVNTSTCLHGSDKGGCNACASVCPEQIDLHETTSVQQLGLCTRCGECAKKCPTASISFGGIGKIVRESEKEPTS